MKDKQLTARSKSVLSPVIGRFCELEISHGDGCYLYTTDQRKILDFASGIAVTSTGHCHPHVVGAIQKQAQTLIHPCIGMGFYEPSTQLAEKLVDITGDTSVFFCQSGSEAVETAIKLARYVSKKQKIVAFKGGFHGRTYGALSLTSSKKKYWEGYGKLLQDIEFFPFPYTYRCPYGKTTQEESLSASLDALRSSPLFSQDTAAVIIETVQGEGGYIPAPIPFLETLSEVCKKQDILLIIDEIQSGIGRTGKWFGYQHATIKPDIIVSAKGLASGMPLAACIAKKSIMNQWPAGAHGGTYGGNPVTCAAGLATLDIVEQYIPTVKKHSDFSKDILTTQLKNHPYVGDIRINGLMIGIEFVKDKQTKDPASDFVQTILKKCLEKNFLVISCGLHNNVIRLIPPLIIDQETLQEGLLTLCEVINANH